MADRGDEQAHGGILIRGADGNLWFWLDSWDEPRRLDEKLAANIDRHLGFVPERDRDQGVDQQLSFPLRQEVIDELAGHYGFIVWPFGILFYRAARLRS